MEDELYHYGVKGMKWGIRKHRSRGPSLRKQRRDAVKDRRKASKNRTLLSDEELDRRLKRVRKEDEFRRLTEQNYHKGRSTAKQTLSKIGNQAVTAAFGAATAVVVANVVKPGVTKVVNDFVRMTPPNGGVVNLK